MESKLNFWLYWTSFQVSRDALLEQKQERTGNTTMILIKFFLNVYVWFLPSYLYIFERKNSIFPLLEWIHFTWHVIKWKHCKKHLGKLWNTEKIWKVDELMRLTYSTLEVTNPKNNKIRVGTHFMWNVFQFFVHCARFFLFKCWKKGCLKGKSTALNENVKRMRV